MYKHKKKLVAIFSGFLALLMILSIVAMALNAGAASDISEQNLKTLKDKKNQLANDKKVLQNALSGLQSQERDAMATKTNLENQLSVLDEQIATSEALIESYDEQIAEKEVEIELAQQDEADEFALYKKRVRAMEENSHVSDWAVLLGATSFSDFLARAEVMRDIANYDNELMQSLKEIREGIQAMKADIEEDKAFSEEVKADLEAQKEEAEQKSKEVDELLGELKNKKDYTAEELAKITKEIDDCAAEADRVAKELAKRKKYVGGEYRWPLENNFTVTQEYKWRTHQITGKYTLHNGIDIGAQTGTPILAANSGTVIVSQFNTAWGEYVQIDHGGGNVTLYAHMSKRLVKVGQEVKQGDVIGKVGSTGYSTGPHLHFTIYVNGASVDPRKYFPK